MAKLIIEKGVDKGKTFKIPKLEEITIGREGTIQFRIGDLMASRKHFKIVGRQEGFHLVDLNSLNGTFLNGKRVKTSAINNGDLITVGETLFSFNMEDIRQDELVGRMLGGYRIIDRIGRGGMGVVYKAEQVDLQRIVALKVLSREGAKEEERIEALFREARAAAQLNHHNIVQVYDVRNEQGVHFFSMEYMPGGSVQELLNREKTIPAKQAVAMILDAARGLEYAHKKGILHRDIKPDNLMIAESGIAKIGDLGLAKSFADDKADDGNVVFGTPHYIAPEQITGTPASIQSDIYSLGATFYRMTVGVTPFNAPTVKELLSKKIKEDPHPPHLANAQLSPKVSTVIMRMMHRLPEQRFKEMGEVIAELGRLQTALESQVKTQSSLPTIASKAPREKSSNIPVFAAAAGIIAAGIVVALLITSNGRQDPITPPVKESPRMTTDEGAKTDSREVVAGKLYAEAEEFARRLDRSNSSQIRKAIEAYALVAEKGEGTLYAAKANDRRQELTSLMMIADAESQLRKIEDAERKTYNEVVPPFISSLSEMIALDRIEQSAKVYEEFAKSEYRATPAAKKAESYAAHIKKWIGLVGETQKKYALKSKNALDAFKQMRFHDADTTLQAFIDDARQQALQDNILGRRYSSLLFDEKARKAQTKVREEAIIAFEADKRQSERCASRNEFAQAAAFLQPAITTYKIPAIADEAKRLQDRLIKREEEYKKNLADQAEADRKRKEQNDRALYDACCIDRLFPAVMKYDFASAVAALEELKGKIQDAGVKDLVARRIGNLQTAASMKGILINNLNSPPSEKRVRPDFFYLKESKNLEIPVGSKTMSAASQQILYYKIPGGGTKGERWETFFDPAGFVDFIKRRWDLSTDEQKQLAILALEIGQYEFAEKILVSNTQVETEDILRHARQRDYTGSSEYDCLISINRIERFIERKESIKAADELEYCKNKYPETKAFSSNREKLRGFEGGVKERPPDKKDPKRAVIDGKDIEIAPTIEKKVADVKPASILAAANRIPDQMEKALVYGEIYFALEDHANAMKQFNWILTYTDKITKDQPKEFAVLAKAYANIVKTHAVTLNPVFRQAFEQANNRFGDQDVWKPLKEGLTRFLEGYRENYLRSEEIRKSLNRNPDNPDDIWQLGCLYSRMAQPLKAAGYFRTLVIHYPEYAEVRSGECLYRIAEFHLEARNFAKAIELLEEMKKNHADHPKVKNKEEWDSVDNKIKRGEDFLDRYGK